MAQQGWKCSTCGATNPFGNPRCRICQTLEATAVAGAPPPPQPTPPVGAATTTFPLPPPPPPPPPPPSGYAAPPPGWYPGAPLPRRPRRTWLIIVSIVVPVLLLIGFGLVYARGTDPGAAKDRDAAEKTLLTNGDLGGTFREVAHRAFARSRGGIKIEGDIADCSTTDSAFEKDGQAGVDSILQSQTSSSVQIVAEEVLIVGSSDSATPVLDALAGTARSCVTAALRNSAGGSAISLQLAASPAPTLGERAVAFDGSASIGRAAVAVDILVVQQGRAIGLLMTFDTTGSFHGPRLESAMRTLLGRLAPAFGQ